jgi:glutamate-1-semialdehyde 2,1-aminomutase
MGVVVPPRAYLSGLLEIAEKDGALVIFDEVMTGFRLALGGAQELFSLAPPLTCMGKVLGGGLPIGAVGGRRDIMEQMAPVGPVYQAGTLSGNPLAVAAGLETLKLLESDPPYASLDQKSLALCQGLKDAARVAGIPVQIQRCGSMFTLFFCDQPVTDFEMAKLSDTNRFSRFHEGMLEHGVYLAPSQFEACFVSTAHDDEAISVTIEAARSVLSQLDQ